MAKVKDHQKAPDDSFGAHLARLRNAKGLSLRQVEEATEGEVSNAYLSQLENNKIAKPSPNILYVLAGVYATSYEDLMKRAGYFTSDAKATGQRQARAATFAIQDLTPEEETILIDYLAFIRKQKRK
ncbi:MAG: helix-turn-helix domain-containing protein [Acidobacteria bacterium]|nr:helix-turn-helix domain-containing protein [Acidobacteriota bacterium]